MLEAPAAGVLNETDLSPAFKYSVIFHFADRGCARLTNVSRIAERILLALFASFLAFLAQLGFAYLVGEAIALPITGVAAITA